MKTKKKFDKTTLAERKNLLRALKEVEGDIVAWQKVKEENQRTMETLVEITYEMNNKIENRKKYAENIKKEIKELKMKK